MAGLSSVTLPTTVPAMGMSLLPFTVNEAVALSEVSLAAEELSLTTYVKLVACEKLALRLSKGVKVTMELVEEPMFKGVPVALSVSLPC